MQALKNPPKRPSRRRDERRILHGIADYFRGLADQIDAIPTKGVYP